VVQVVEGHVGEGISEEVGIDFAVGNSACILFSVSVLTGVGGGAQRWVVVTWSEWEGQTGQNINVLHREIAGGSSVVVINPDAIFAVPPSVTVTVDGVHNWSSWQVRVTEVAPASVFEDVGQGE